MLAANNIPHGIEEMAWDAYLNNVGWSLLLPKVLFSVHRSLLAGRNTKKGDDPFAGIAVSSEEEHSHLRFSREEIDVGKAEKGGDLPCCHHSHAIDCAEESAEWLETPEGVKFGGKRSCVPCTD